MESKDNKKEIIVSKLLSIHIHIFVSLFIADFYGKLEFVTVVGKRMDWSHIVLLVVVKYNCNTLL